LYTVDKLRDTQREEHGEMHLPTGGERECRGKTRAALQQPTGIESKGNAARCFPFASFPLSCLWPMIKKIP
jgi:hypothetical protein